jgi:TRAP-type C4-dicarboxylate transport system permease small subunit
MKINFYLKIKKIESTLYEILSNFVLIALVILLFLIAFRIISRYFGLPYLAPPDEIITLVYVWMLFIGTAVLVRNMDHIRIELLDNFLKDRPKLKSIYNMVVCLLILIFLLVMIKSSLVLYEKSGTRASPMLQWPQRMWYISLPISGFLMTFYLMVRFFRNTYELLKKKT